MRLAHTESDKQRRFSCFTMCYVKANCIKFSRAASIALMIALPTFGFALNRMFSDSG